MTEFIGVIIVLVSLCIGSFLNVVIYRYPIMLMNGWKKEAQAFLHPNESSSLHDPPANAFNLCLPRSHCPECKHRLLLRDNIPVLSFFLIKGRCRHCRASISARYPLVEFFTALLSLLLYLHFGLSVLFILATLFLYCLITLFFIDIDHQLIPDNIVLPLLWLGLLINSQHYFTSLFHAVTGAVLGYMMLWIIAKLYQAIRKRQGIGHGDFKMLAMIGAWFGVTTVPIALLFACISSIVITGSLMIYKKMPFDTATAFGPYLAIAAFSMLLWQQPILTWLSQLLG